MDTPGYADGKRAARISFRSIEMMAVLETAPQLPQLNEVALLGYVFRAINSGKLYRFVAENLLAHGAHPDINLVIAVLQTIGIPFVMITTESRAHGHHCRAASALRGCSGQLPGAPRARSARRQAVGLTSTC